ncbi:Linear gramicidin synthase subunit D [compost metagenome]
MLGAERVGRHDNFFELGGHSLLATRIVAAVRAELGRDLKLEQLFTCPRLDLLAQALEAAPAAGRAGPRLHEATVGEQGELSYAQQRLWFLWKLDPSGTAMNIPMAFLLRGPLDLDALAAAAQGLIDRHEMLRTVFGEDEGRAWQRVLPAGAMALAVDRCAVSGDRDAWQATARQYAARPFDLANGPLLRVGAGRIDSDTHLLIVVAHHIVADGWSSKVMLRDFLQGYDAARKGRRLEAPMGAARYLAYAAAQRRWLDEGESARQAEAWRAELAGFEPLKLAPELPPTARRGHPLRTAGFELDAALTARIARTAGEARATPYMLLWAATAAALAARTGQRRFYLGTDVANRETPGTQDMVGFFVNQLALPVDCGAAATGAALLAQVRHTVLAAASRQDLPFDRLVAALGSRDRGGRAPLFQVKVIHQDGLPSVDVAGLELEVVPVHGEEAELDLIVSYIALPDRIQATLLYDAECFEAASMDSLAGEIAAVILTLANDVAASLRTLEDAARAARQRATDRFAGERDARLGALRDGLKRRRIRPGAAQ